MTLAALVFLLASNEFTLYELLPPETHQFAITYDVTQDKEGADFFLNPIRPGSISTKSPTSKSLTPARFALGEATM